VINYIQNHLQGKLFLSYLAIILTSALVFGFITSFTINSAFENHLGRMQQQLAAESTDAPSNERGGMRFGVNGTGQRPENSFGVSLYNNFQASFREALLLAAIASLPIALLLSFSVSRKVVAPVRSMMLASQRVADGHYDERVQANSSDELGQLAHSFNQMAAQLEEVEEMRRQLIGDVAHELRTPLTVIKGSMEGLQDGILPATSETYQPVLREADRLNHLVDDLQELSRVEAGAYELHFAPLKLSSLKDTLTKRLGYRFKEKGIEFDCNLPQNLPVVQADEHRLIQVLTNLLTNALYYTPEGGKVSLQAHAKNNEILVSVKDNGIGIPPEHLDNIFTRFYRVDKSRSRHAGGSGIGLTITKHLVEAHGGKIWVESEGKDKGSTFFFTLPIRK
jgi:histidine kinase